MKFECPNCEKTGQVDDSSIPNEGVYATCPVCGTKFFISKSSSDFTFEPAKSNIKHTTIANDNRTSDTQPQDSRGATLLKVCDYFWLFEKSFYFNGHDYLYEGIYSICYSNSKSTVNLYTVNSSASLLINHDKVERIFISYDKHHKTEGACDKGTIVSASNIISQKSYKQRLSRYLNELNTVGFISIPQYKSEVRIYANGDVLQEGLRYNLAKSYAKKRLQIGLDFRWGASTHETDPSEIILAEEGWLFWNKKITFYIHTDYDVLVAVLKSLAGVA